MITEYDLNSAIAECQGKPNPDAKTCMMLAAFYTIKREMFGEKQSEVSAGYSYAPPPESTAESLIQIDSDSEFARAIDGRPQNEILPIINELMETLQIIQPRLYNAVMDKLT